MKKVIYTCITGSYDDLKEPIVITEGWDYICFYDDLPKHNKDTVWKLIKMGVTNDVIRHQRKKKIFNEYILDEYDLSIWADGSLFVNCDLDKFIEPLKDDFVLMQHPAQTCIVGEARGILALKKDTKESLDNQINTYFNDGYPENNGMVATGVMIRKHTEEVKSFCKLWLNEVIKHSHRDQMSFNYTAWKNNFKFGMISFRTIYGQFIIRNHVKEKRF